MHHPIEMVCFPPYRLCELRQSDQCAGGDPGHERLPDRHEAPQGAAETSQGCQQALLSQLHLAAECRRNDP